MTIEDRIEVLRHLSQLLREATILRIERDKQERLNQRRKSPDWSAHEALSAKMREINDYLMPDGHSLPGLHAKYCADPAFECYVLVVD